MQVTSESPRTRSRHGGHGDLVAGGASTDGFLHLYTSVGTERIDSDRKHRSDGSSGREIQQREQDVRNVRTDMMQKNNQTEVDEVNVVIRIRARLFGILFASLLLLYARIIISGVPIGYTTYTLDAFENKHYFHSIDDR